MRIYGVTADQIRAAVAKVNATEYGGNVVIENLSTQNAKGTIHSVKLGTADSHSHGSRTSWSGRHGRYLCWHGFRDVFREIFKANPSARITTAQANYNGSVVFEDLYPVTADNNIGSMVQPAYMPDLCVGHCAGDWQ